MSGLGWIDWQRAATTGVRLVPRGPRLTAVGCHRIVAELHECARVAPGLVAEAAGLDAGLAAVPELVVDRPGMVRTNVEIMAASYARVAEYTDPGPLRKVMGQLRADGIGGVLAMLVPRILGQYDALSGRPRLLLNAPTIAHVEAELEVNPADFRMWVCLHESTHRLQFGNATWLVDFMVDRMAELIAASEEPASPLADLGERLARVRRDTREARPLSMRVVDAVSSPRTFAVFDQLSGLMSLLEGHADVMMDRAGPGVIATLPTIRSRFDGRRNRIGLAAMIGKLLGMDAKLAQYRDGATFCRSVIETAGVPTLNMAFRGPKQLPSMTEILHPDLWLARISAVSGPDAVGAVIG